MVHILSGENIAKSQLRELAKQTKGKRLKLLVLQVGKNPVSAKYIREKEKACKELGIGFELITFPKTISSEVLGRAIQKRGEDPGITGMIVQLPLPSSMTQKKVLDAIPLRKDVDVLSSQALGLFALGQFPILPPTVRAISLLLEQCRVQLKGKYVVLVGAGRLVGLPLSLWFMRQGATLTVANKFTKNLSSFTRTADILISGVGKAKLIRGDMVKKGAIVIDAGTSVESGPSTPLRVKKIQGDVDFKSVSKKAKFISPVPGGVGPLTVACLFQNLTKLNSRDM